MIENDFISINIAVVTISDTRVLKKDKSGDTLVNRITQFGHKVTVRKIVKDDFDNISDLFVKLLKNNNRKTKNIKWNGETLSEKQLEYAANDVIYLHKIKDELEKMSVREKRIDIFNKCLNFLDTRVELDQNGFKFEIFEH